MRVCGVCCVAATWKVKPIKKAVSQEPEVSSSTPGTSPRLYAFKPRRTAVGLPVHMKSHQLILVGWFSRVRLTPTRPKTRKITSQSKGVKGSNGFRMVWKKVYWLPVSGTMTKNLSL